MIKSTRQGPPARRAGSILATLGLLTGMLALTTGSAAATSLVVNDTQSVYGPNASITITVNRQPKAIAACGFVADGGSPIDCGTPSSSAKNSTTFAIVLRGVPAGDHILIVTVRLTDHATATRTVSFSVSSAPCQVRNQRTRDRYDGTGANLQLAVDASLVGDTLEVWGRCVGNFRLTNKTLTLLGVALNGDPMATLDGNGSGHVVLLDLCPPPNPICPTDITLTDLLITNGSLGGTSLNDLGGGIYNNHSTLTLSGSTEVSGNHAAYGGGIASFGTTTINDSVRITGNTATIDGGGFYNFGGTLTVDGTAEVTANTAGAAGGGIFNFGTFNACDTWIGALSPNAPDDPPTPTLVTC